MYKQKNPTDKLLRAVEENALETLKELLLADTSIIGTRNNKTCEQIAIENNNPAILELLLCYAVYKNWYDVAQTLILAKAPTTGTWQDKNCEQLALMNNSPKMLLLLHLKEKTESILTLDVPQERMPMARRPTQKHVIISPTSAAPTSEKKKDPKPTTFLSAFSFLKGQDNKAKKSFSQTPSPFAALHFGDSPNLSIEPLPPEGFNLNDPPLPDSTETTFTHK